MTPLADGLLTHLGNVGRLPRFKPRETRAWSGAGRHVSGQDVVRVAVQVLACSLWRTASWCAGRRGGQRSEHRAGQRQHRAWS
jgi:hypothetical protein